MSGPEIVVVGGGPAGLTAAAAAAAAGADVVLFDERPTLGGQLRYRLTAVRADPDLAPAPAAGLATRLVAEATAAGVKLSANALVWSVFGDGTLGVSVDGRPSLVQPVVTVVATGSTDLPLPLAGGSLPGVFSARAVLIAVNEWRVRPGRRWAIVGGGPERDEVAEAVGLAGGEVVVTADAAAGDEVVAEGASGVEAVAINGRRFVVDCVAVAAGRQPDAALAVMAGCALGPDPIGGGLVPVVDAYGRSSDPRIVVAGDAAGVCDPEVALAEGRLAGLAAAAVVGRIPEDRLLDALERERVVLAARLADRSAQAATYVQPYR